MDVLQLLNKNKEKVAGLIKYKDLCIESVLTTGDKTLSFSYPKKDKFFGLIEKEGYVETKKNIYVIKADDTGGDYTRFTCILNLEELEGQIVGRFESVEQTITASLNLAIVGTGWTVKDNTLKKKRTVRCTNKNALEIVREIKKTYRVDIVFNTLEKQIEVYEHLGEDKGTYFIDSLNLKALQIQSDSYKYVTRIIAEGKDGLSFADINGGKNYVENYQYSNKVKTIYWKDDRYTVKESLLEDARAKLEELSKPFVSYNASILNLAELNPKYKNILDYRLGDTITLISKENKIKDKQRIVKVTEYPQDHSKDTVEIANATLTFEDIQQENQEAVDTVSNITTDNGTIDGSTVDGITTKQIEDFEVNVAKVTNLHAINADIDYLKVKKADMQDVNIVKANIGTLFSTKAEITELNSVKANLEQAIIKKANITDLNAASGKISVLESKTASIENALNKNLTAENIATGAITAGSGIIANGAIGDAEISSLSVNKLKAGDITTSKHRIVSADGTIEIVGNQLLINRNNINRVVLGEYRKKDGTTDYGLLVRALDGQTIMLDGNGVHNAGITDGAIDNNKVADNANISGNKLDINSVIREVNKGTETIKGTKVTVGDRTLDIELSTQNNTITEQGKELSSQKATIQALDNAIKLKVDTQTYTNNINTIKDNISTTNSNLSKATTELNLLKGEVSSKVNKSEIDKTIKEIEDNIKIATDKITTVESNFTQKTNSIEANVRDLSSTTESITSNVSNINRDLTNKINSNLDAAKNFATDIATNKASTAKQEAINSANSHADSIAAGKATEALNNAKAYTNAQINTVNTKVHNIESNITILTDRINSKVSQSDVDKSISTIQIGGRNYGLATNIMKQEPYNVSFSSALVFEKNKTYTISLDFDVENLVAGSQSRVGCECSIGFDDNTRFYIGIWHYINQGNFKGRKSFTFTLPNKNIVDIPKGIHIYTELVSSGKRLLGKLKLEEGNKATDYTEAPEDTNQLIVDNIRVVDTKISDVSSNVTQLKDSVTTQINSINSKTQSIESNLSGKASKQEVTDVNNKVTTIKASLDSITQRVSSTESKTHTLESNLTGKASKQEVVNITSRVTTVEANLSGITSRVSSTETFTKSLNDKLWEATNKLNNVEQRITPTSIINIVSSSYYQKGEVNNLFSTKSEVEQLDNRINYKFSNTGYSNLIFNGNFINGTVHWRNWGNCSLVAEKGQLTVRAKKSSNNANIGAVSSVFVLEKDKKYTLTFQGCSSWNIPWLNYVYLLGEDGVNHRLDLKIDINSSELVYRTATFTAPATKYVRLLIGVEGYLQTDVSGFKLVDVCLVEGDIPRRFIPNANEISEGSTSIDNNGVIVRFADNSYVSMTHGGFAWKTKNMEKAYHCLAETGWVNISTGAWLGDHYDIKITLPSYFRGKVFTPCSMIQGWYVESNFSLNQLVVNIPFETINYSEGSFIIRVKALTRDGTFQRNINISWLAIA